jgi:phosphoribosylanthranilate isomerase
MRHCASPKKSQRKTEEFSMTVETKICGISSRDAMSVAVDGGASYVGLVFYPPSPRAVTAQQAASLCENVPGGVIKVGLFVDIDDDTLDSIISSVPLNLLQLHGSETPERVTQIKQRSGLPVIKAIKIASADDVATATAYFDTADRLLFDAKAPADMKGALPGGNALMFDWQLIAGRIWPLPWMLSGGLDAENVAEAIRVTGAGAVDVSSGVESAPGVKDVARIAAFLKAVATA